MAPHGRCCVASMRRWHALTERCAGAHSTVIIFRFTVPLGRRSCARQMFRRTTLLFAPYTRPDPPPNTHYLEPNNVVDE